MHRKAIALWEQMSLEEKFLFLRELDKRTGGATMPGNGLAGLRRSYLFKLEQVKEIDAINKTGHE